MSTESRSSGGIGFGGAMAILFIGLKLGGVIDWSWLWVLSPLWIPVVVVLAVLVALGIAWLFCALMVCVLERPSCRPARRR